jgi:small subunit ribosomal protein S1
MIDPTTGQRISSLYAYERLDPLAIANRQSNDMENMQSLIEATEHGFQALRRGQIISGIIVCVDQEGVLVDIGLKSEAVVPNREVYGENEEPYPLTVGQEVLVQVLQPDSPQGPIVSLRRARREQAWRMVEQLAASEGMLEATVVEENKGGVIVDVQGLRGFVPFSQLVSIRPSSRENGEKVATARGRRLTLKVVDANQRANRLILSERAADQELRARRRAALLQELQPGQIRRGRVTNVTTFGAFVDLGGADGLIHVSELSYERVTDARDVLQVGQEIEVYVIDVWPEEQKIALSRKRAMPDPWNTVPLRYQRGQVVSATITRLTKFGAFAQIEPGVEGLIHLSELDVVTPRTPGEVVHEGQVVELKIVHIDPARRRLGLSLRQVEHRLATSAETPREESREDAKPSAFAALASMAEALTTIHETVTTKLDVSEADEALSEAETVTLTQNEEAAAPLAGDGTAALVDSEGTAPQKKRDE